MRPSYVLSLEQLETRDTPASAVFPNMGEMMAVAEGMRWQTQLVESQRVATNASMINTLQAQVARPPVQNTAAMDAAFASLGLDDDPLAMAKTSLMYSEEASQPLPTPPLGVGQISRAAAAKVLQNIMPIHEQLMLPFEDREYLWALRKATQGHGTVSEMDSRLPFAYFY